MQTPVPTSGVFSVDFSAVDANERRRAMPERHKGYVVGSDTSSSGQLVWKVRVKDTQSSYDGQKLNVASSHKELTLARGLNVNFAIGTVDDHEGNKVLRAVDVCLETPSANQSKGQPVKRS